MRAHACWLAAVLASSACWPAVHAQGEADVLLETFTNLVGFTDVLSNNNFTGWGRETPVCQWGGVTCNTGGQVDNVTLPGGGYIDADGNAHEGPYAPPLAGNVSTVLLQLARLPALRAIRLPFHSLGGTLPGPEFLERAAQLEELYLPTRDSNYGDSGLEGELPLGWRSKSLRRLNLEGGVWSGPLPLGWGKDGVSFQKLELLHITRRTRHVGYLDTSAIPASWPAQLPSMKSLVLRGVNITGTLPASLKAWNLTWLDLQTNRLTGPLPPQFAANGSQPALKFLGLARNRFAGTIPAAWGTNGALASLEGLTLADTNITGPLPAAWLARPPPLPKLQELYIGETEICGAVPANVTITSTSLIHGITGAVTLINAITDLGPCDEASSKGANYSETEFSRGVLLGLKRLVPNFEEVYAAHNMSGWKDDSGDYCEWSMVRCDTSRKVVGLRLNLNKSSEPYQSVDQEDFSFSRVDLKRWTTPAAPSSPGPVFTGNISAVLLQLTKLRLLQSLDVSNNRFEGELPGRELAQQAQYLKYLYASNNRISGSLPSGAEWTFPNLLLLILDHNALQGTLPADWGRASTRLGTPLLLFAFIGVQANRLEGTLPASWGERLGNLTGIDASDNKLSGTLPDKWSSLTNLRKLKLARNTLSGQLPASWGDNSTGTDMHELTTLDLSNNTLTGTLPAAWGNRRGMYNIAFMNFAGNQLRGSIPPSWSELDAASLVYTIQASSNLTFPSLTRLDLRPGNPGVCGAVPPGLVNATFKAAYEVSLFAEASTWRQPRDYSYVPGALLPYTLVPVPEPTQAQNETLASYGPCPAAGSA